MIGGDTRLCLTSRWFIQPGREEEVLAAIRSELVPAIEAGEAGTLTYYVHRPCSGGDALQSLPPTDGQLLLFYEEYASPAAFQAHVEGPAFTDFVARHGACFVQAGGKPYTTVTFLARQAGFTRGAASAVHQQGPGNCYPAVMFEVLAPDQQRAEDFYAKVFGWSYQRGAEGFGYIHFPAGTPPLLGGIGQAEPQVAGMAPGTNFYLLVDDLEAMLARAIDAGGTLLMPPTTVDGYDFAMFSDPDGFAIGLVTPFVG